MVLTRPRYMSTQRKGFTLGLLRNGIFYFFGLGSLYILGIPTMICPLARANQASSYTIAVKIYHLSAFQWVNE